MWGNRSIYLLSQCRAANAARHDSVLRARGETGTANTVRGTRNNAVVILVDGLRGFAADNAA